MPPQLILNADDFGLTPGINRAVEELHQAGALTSATLMASGPAFDHAVEVAERNPALGVGCHLVFVDGTPVAPPGTISSLLGTSTAFRASYPSFVQAVLLGSILQQDIATEAEAQIRRLQAAGIHVTHVDSHKHTHLLPGIARPVLQAAARCGVHAFRNPFEPRWSRDVVRSLVPLRRRLEQTALDLFQPAFRRVTAPFAAADLETTSGTLGIAATGTLDDHSLRSILQAAQENGSDCTYELCCHPGYDDADLALQSTRLRASRAVELRALLAVVPEYSRSSQALQLIHYGASPLTAHESVRQVCPTNGASKTEVRT